MPGAGIDQEAIRLGAERNSDGLRLAEVGVPYHNLRKRVNWLERECRLIRTYLKIA